MNEPRILLIGRWSPFHNGHKALVDSFLKIGKKVVIAIRETDEKYPVYLRMTMIRAVYPGDELVKIIVIPDIEGVAIGRDVGYYFVEIFPIIGIHFLSFPSLLLRCIVEVLFHYFRAVFRLLFCIRRRYLLCFCLPLSPSLFDDIIARLTNFVKYYSISL